MEPGGLVIGFTVAPAKRAQAQAEAAKLQNAVYAARVRIEIEVLRGKLAGDAALADVVEDEDTAGRIGITGVPFFIANGKLAVSAWPLSLEPVTPADLKQWLDEAGIKWRVISVSACYSGSWIDPLANDNTLVMTAADADHTSYGCGRRSTLTYFGRAMYEEGMRATWSFKDAHAEARKVIEVREQEAGKTDGYSNPQIQVGEGIRPKLAELAGRLDAAAQ